MQEETILQEATRLVSSDRQKAYGHPADDFKRTTGMLNSLGFRFCRPDGSMRELESTDFAIIMMAAKLSRQVNQHKRDNLVDLAGYSQTLQMTYDRESQTNNK